MKTNHSTSFLDHCKAAISQNIFVKITFSKPKDLSENLTNIYIRPVEIKGKLLYSVNYRYTTNDRSENIDNEMVVLYIKTIIEEKMNNADLFTAQNDVHFVQFPNGKEKLFIANPTLKPIENPEHNHLKNRTISTKNNLYLQFLGVCNPAGNIIAGMNDKFVQINRYIEVLSSLIKALDLKSNTKILDMGAGKGYLTFALFDYLTKNFADKTFEIKGIEARNELVIKCNAIAQKCEMNGLVFQAGTIENTTDKSDILIALHACDTATDDAIFQGIQTDCQLIVVSPCCHKQLRTQMNPVEDLKPILKHGILEERQSEIITDTVRAMILEHYGYKTQIMEFVTAEHTGKNLMITAIKNHKPKNVSELNLKLGNLKKLFGFQSHYLEKKCNL